MKTLIKLSKGLLAIIIISLTISTLNYTLISCKKIDYFDVEEITNQSSQIINFKEAFVSIARKHNIDKTLFQDFKGDNINSNIDFESFLEEIQPYSVSYIMSYGISEQEIQDAFGNFDDIAITTTALMVAQTNELLDMGYTLDIFEDSDYISYLVNNILGSAFAQTVGGCALEAFGIKAIMDAIEGYANKKKLGAKGIKKLMFKVASKYLGVVGTALSILHFADCMGWFD